MGGKMCIRDRKSPLATALVASLIAEIGLKIAVPSILARIVLKIILSTQRKTTLSGS